MRKERVNFIASAISDFQLVPHDDLLKGLSAFERSYLIGHMTDNHMLEMNKAFKANNREKLGYLLEQILYQAVEREQKEQDDE